MSRAHYIVGDALKVLATLPDDSIDLCVSSPPYLALRSYLPADDPAKADEMGSEATPGEFVDALLDVAEECRRVLAPHGTLCFELGDSYAGSGGAGGDYALGGLREGQEKFDGTQYRARDDTKFPKVQRGAMAGGGITNLHGKVQPGGEGWPEPKSLTLIPESFRWALAYGRNPFTGRETPRWRVRNVVRHFRPNPPVGALGDKFRPATSEWVVACESRSRYFDLDAVRVATDEAVKVVKVGAASAGKGITGGDNGNPDKERLSHNPAGAPPLDWWADDYEVVESFVAPTFGYSGAHYATFSPKVVARFIEAMCPAKVCGECGEPSRRVVRVDSDTGGAYVETTKAGGTREPGTGDRGGSSFMPAAAVTLGWTDCGHDAYRPGRVLDPFGGSGTTAQVATGHGRDCLLVDLDRRNVGLAYERIGMFLTDAALGDDGAHLPDWL